MRSCLLYRHEATYSIVVCLWSLAVGMRSTEREVRPSQEFGPTEVNQRSYINVRAGPHDATNDQYRLDNIQDKFFNYVSHGLTLAQGLGRVSIARASSFMNMTSDAKAGNHPFLNQTVCPPVGYVCLGVGCIVVVFVIVKIVMERREHQKTPPKSCLSPKRAGAGAEGEETRSPRARSSVSFADEVTDSSDDDDEFPASGVLPNQGVMQVCLTDTATSQNSAPPASSTAKYPVDRTGTLTEWYTNDDNNTKPLPQPAVYDMQAQDVDDDSVERPRSGSVMVPEISSDGSVMNYRSSEGPATYQRKQNKRVSKAAQAGRM